MAKKKATKRTRNAGARQAPEVPAVAAGGLGVPRRGVRVRMYRYGFGDCFLLSFGRNEEGTNAPLHMLIDCGLLPGASSANVAKLKLAVEDIKAVTGGHLDILACTHEHADHLSGFLHAKSIWEQITIGELWLAWTEDPADALAKQLRDQRAMRLRGLRGALPAMKAAGMTGIAPLAAAQVQAALGFFGASGTSTDTRAALEFVRSRVSRKPRYWRPGSQITPTSLDGVRFFVLGPPRDQKMLLKDKPSGGGQSEVYHVAGALSGDAAFFAGVGGSEPEGADQDDARTQRERACPFDAAMAIHPSEVAAADADGDGEADVLHARYLAASSDEVDETVIGGRVVSVSAWESEQDWRRIDDDWMAAAGSMALKLDEDTNNTSLVLAIELSGSGRVLLFPGDAQVGSWLSWDQCSWKLHGPDGMERQVDAPDLLARTVLYKVGHHASHNATLKEKGLERMVSPDLVALIPVDEATAKKQGAHGWKMPFPPLLKRLTTKTSGRVLRADGGIPDRPSTVPDRVWTRFTRHTRATDLFIDHVIDEAAD